MHDEKKNGASFNLQNLSVEWGRAEDLGQSDRRESFDVVTARAVAATRVLAEFCLPLCRVGGVWIAPKQSRDVAGGPSVLDEVRDAERAITKLGGVVLGIEDVASFGETGQRTALVVSKTRPTPPAYPRKPGVPSKRPL